MSTIEENAALAKIANGATVASAGNAKARIGKSVVHVRYCSRNLSAPDKFKFNINPNTLSADYELWVCGSAALYYLMPIAFMAFTTTPTPTSTAAALACSLRAARSGGRLPQADMV